MALTSTEYKYISIAENQVPIIAGTTMKVVELVTPYLVHSLSPEELHLHYPHLTLAQIYLTLAYYWDHQAAIEADIQRRLELSEQLRQAAPLSPVVAKLRAKGLLT